MKRPKANKMGWKKKIKSKKEKEKKYGPKLRRIENVILHITCTIT